MTKIQFNNKELFSMALKIIGIIFFLQAIGALPMIGMQISMVIKETPPLTRYFFSISFVIFSI